jgi:hypothetical protein
VSNSVSNPFKKNSNKVECLRRVKIIYNWGICLTIVYQHDSTNVMLILDKSSQDLTLRGYPIGIKVSLFSCRSMLSTFNVSLIFKSPFEGKQNLLHQRRWDASHTCDCDRAIHKANIQGNSDWRFELTNDK